MAEMQIGRITGLAEPQEFGQPDQSTVTFSVLATPTQARQLLGHGDNGAERFVPIDFGTWGGEHDGIYELLEVSVDADPNLDAAGLRQVSVTARSQNRGAFVANSVLLVRGDNRDRTAAVGVTGPLYRASVTSAATELSSFNAGPGGFTVGSAVPTLGRNSVVRLTDGSQVKTAVARATTANITLSGTVSVDGANAANASRVLVKNQTTASQNGIYVVNTGGAWTRATDADGGTELNGAIVYVTSGTANAATTWQMVTPNVTIGTTAQTWQRSPVWGLQQSDRGGPVSITYASPLANWYDGACTITQGSTVVTGANPTPGGSSLVMDNGLVQIAGSTIKMATGSPLAWGEGRNIVVTLVALNGSSSITGTLSSGTIISNTSDLAVLRSRMSGDIPGVVDVSIRRGSRTVTVAISATQRVYAHVGISSGVTADSIFFISPAPEAGTGAGFTSALDNMQYSASNDGDGNRRGISYAGVLNTTALGGSSYLSSTAKRSHVFGIHHIIGGGATKTGDDQLYGASREWFAMLAAQTSAGVL
jgi:hypothetical protein